MFWKKKKKKLICNSIIRQYSVGVTKKIKANAEQKSCMLHGMEILGGREGNRHLKFTRKRDKLVKMHSVVNINGQLTEHAEIGRGVGDELFYVKLYHVCKISTTHLDVATKIGQLVKTRCYKIEFFKVHPLGMGIIFFFFPEHFPLTKG